MEVLSAGKKDPFMGQQVSLEACPWPVADLPLLFCRQASHAHPLHLVSVSHSFSSSSVGSGAPHLLQTGPLGVQPRLLAGGGVGLPAASGSGRPTALYLVS